MIWQLMKRDPAMAMLPWLVIGMAAFSLTQVNSVVAFPVVVIMAAITRTDWRYLLALPVRREDIYLARMAAAMTLIWAPVLVATGIVELLGRSGGSMFFLAATLAMPPVLAQEALIVRGKLISATWTLGLTTALTTAFISFAAMARKAIPTAPVALVCVLLSVGLFAHTWYTIPRLGTGREFMAPAKTGAAGAFRARRFPWWLLSWFDLIWFGSMLWLPAFGAQASCIMFFWAGPLQPRERFRFLDSLPVSRRLWLMLRVAPLLLAVLIGYAAGLYGNVSPGRADNFNKVYISAGREWPPTRVTSSCAVPNVSPPLDYWRPAAGDTAPLVRAPWGESYRTPVVRIYGYGVYNPYGVGCGNSRRFLDWQYERASMAVYGKLIPKNDPDAAATPRLRLRILEVGGLLAFAILAMMPVMVNDWWRFQKLRKRLRYGLLGTVLGLTYIAFMASMLLPAMRRATWFPANPTQLASWLLPESMTVVVCVCIAIPCAVYWLMQRVLLASEIGSWGQASQSAWEIGRKRYG